ncbi:4-hydroxy-tetrahydrodipicolinate synthase [Candidatus Vidania fulgoroideorum]
MKIKKNLNGCLISLITPMYNNKKINLKEFKKLIKININKANGFVICGTTGESTCLKTSEKIKLAKISRKIIKKKPLIFGNSELSTYKAINLNNKLKNIGVDAILQNTPYYNCNKNKNILAHYKEISKCNIPIILYNVPSRTGIDMDIKTIIKISKLKNIVAIKESSLNIFKILEIKQKTNLICLSGDDITAPTSKYLGSDGVISVTANIFPKIVSKLFNNKKNIKKFYEFNKSIFLESNPCPIKYIMKKMNLINAYKTRLPLVSLNIETKKKILLKYKKWIEKF